jgi:glycosyltransferase involved in cell wall biosynthesis
MLQYTFPDLPVWRFYVSVDSNRFAPQTDPRLNTICYMPRKRARDIACVLGMLASHGVLDAWSIRPLDGLTEAQVAEALSSCAIFLALSDQEGCPLPPLEAMASGALVVGYTGFGAQEYMTGETAVVVPEGDVLMFARELESVLMDWDRTQDQWDRIRSAGRAVATNRYSPEVEEESVVSAFTEILQRIPNTRSLTCTLTRLQASDPADPVMSRIEVRRHVLRSLNKASRSTRTLFRI